MPNQRFSPILRFFAFKQVADIAFVAEQHQQGDKERRPNPRRWGIKTAQQGGGDCGG